MQPDKVPTDSPAQRRLTSPRSALPRGGSQARESLVVLTFSTVAYTILCRIADRDNYYMYMYTTTAVQLY